MPVRVPRFDKTAFAGRGDRLPQEQWAYVREPADVVLLEGWCLGFRSVRVQGAESGNPTASALPHALHTPELEPIDAALLEFEQLYELLDGLIVAQVASPQVVFRWREQAEARSRAAGRGAMSQSEVAAFVECYLPAYRQYLPSLYGEDRDGVGGPFAAKPQLRFFIDDSRTPCADVAEAAGHDMSSERLT